MFSSPDLDSNLISHRLDMERRCLNRASSSSRSRSVAVQVEVSRRRGRDSSPSRPRQTTVSPSPARKANLKNSAVELVLSPSSVA
ncbi:hypothetical protein ACLB2K_035744 [Fragaria x ananassa]